MTSCDMCGSMKPLTPALIEGTTLQVCAPCAKHGKILPKPIQPSEQPAAQRARQRAEAEMDEIIVEDFSRLIKQAREHRGLQQKELAQAVKEKESVIQHIESGSLQLSLALARALEKFLHITLIQVYAPPEKLTSSRDGALTIGDLVNIRKKS